MKIAIIGTGIAGLGAAYLLNRIYDIELFEANDYIGGHTNTITVMDEGQPLNVDTGFIVYNTTTYPLLMRLFDELDVPTQPSNMSFSTSCRRTGFEYGSQIPMGLFARKRNLISPTFWQVITDYLRFGREGEVDRHNPRYQDYTLGEYVKEKGFSQSFVKYQLLPMTSAIWSSPQATIEDFPLVYLLNFYAHHGVLDRRKGVKWRTVTGGSQEYVTKLVQPFRHKIYLNSPVTAVKRYPNHVTLTLKDGSQHTYAHVVIATHSDQALRLLADATPTEQDILGKLPYEQNTAVLHTDENTLPRHRAAWASWNYTLGADGNQEQPASLTYWMNALQSLKSNTNYCVTINPNDPIRPKHIIKTMQYAHPVYTMESLAAQRRLPEINGKNRTHFCGAYCGYGFHEDGLRSGVAAAAQLGVHWDDDKIQTTLTLDNQSVGISSSLPLNM